MKIAIATNNNNTDSPVGAVFGRCNWYCLYDRETKQIEFIENPAKHFDDNAGKNAASSLLETGIDVAIAGRFGSKVVEMFRANGVQMIIPETEKTIKEILKQIK